MNRLVVEFSFGDNENSGKVGKIKLLLMKDKVYKKRIGYG
jgi:hypothetical protein